MSFKKEKYDIYYMKIVLEVIEKQHFLTHFIKRYTALLIYCLLDVKLDTYSKTLQ